jgi:NADPH2:quinone reductase
MPIPVPGEYELLIEVHASAVNPVDTKIRRGLRGQRQLPLVPGYDVSGIVVGLGPKVDHFVIGDAVYASPCLTRNGSAAPYVTVDSRSAAKKPASLDHIQSAALPLVTLTAWESLHERAQIHPGETVLIHAGAGGVGHIALQLARNHGCRVITTASRPQTIALCRELGADVVINHREQDFVKVIMELTGGKGLPCVFDTVGEEIFERSLECVAINGRIVTIVPTTSAKIGPALFPKNATCHFEFMGVPTIHGINPGKQGEVLRTAAELVDAGKLRPHVEQVVELADLPAAHTRQQTGSVIGKIVVKVR